MISANKAVLALVKIDDCVIPRIFYKSNSQSLWRCLPAALKNEGQIHYFGKGKAEFDTQLPIALNLALQTDDTPLISKDSEKNSHTAQDVHDVTKTGYNMAESYQHQIVISPFAFVEAGAAELFINRGFLVPRPPNPSSINLPENSDLAVDFNRCLLATTFEDPKYNTLKAQVYPSKDASLQYLFYEAADGKVFLASIESVKDNPISCFGNRAKQFDTKGLDAPLVEYKLQIPKDYQSENGSVYKHLVHDKKC